MPEYYVDEEFQNRNDFLCELEGVTVSNRCSRCPSAAGAAAAAARPALQRRRCPRDGSLASNFHAAGPQGKTRDDLKSSASSSKLPEAIVRHGTDAPLLEDNLAQMSLEDSSLAGSFHIHSNNNNNSAELSAASPAAPRVDVGDKRKATVAMVDPDRQARVKKQVLCSDLSRQAKVRKQVRCSDLSRQSPEEYLLNKPQKMFRDLDQLYVPSCRHVSEDCWTAMVMENQGARLMAAMPGHPPPATTSYTGSSAAGAFVPGCNMNTEAEGRGMFPCKDGIEILGCSELGELDEMEFEEPLDSPPPSPRSCY